MWYNVLNAEADMNIHVSSVKGNNNVNDATLLTYFCIENVLYKNMLLVLTYTGLIMVIN